MRLPSRNLLLFLLASSFLAILYLYVFPRHQYIDEALELAFDRLHPTHNISSFHLNSYYPHTHVYKTGFNY